VSCEKDLFYCTVHVLILFDYPYFQLGHKGSCLKNNKIRKKKPFLTFTVIVIFKKIINNKKISNSVFKSKGLGKNQISQKLTYSLKNSDLLNLIHSKSLSNLILIRLFCRPVKPYS
jgi:hypothetical protein